MQSDNGSPPSSQQPEVSFPEVSRSKKAEEFEITKDDAAILRELVDEFQEADLDIRTTIIAAAMAEICALRPATDPFNKVVATAVGVHVISFMH
jgi:hypothetical protein